MDFEYFARVARVYETFEETRLLFNDGVTTGGIDSKSARLVMGVGAEDRVGELYGRWQLNIISCILTAATVMSKVIFLLAWLEFLSQLISTKLRNSVTAVSRLMNASQSTRISSSTMCPYGMKSLIVIVVRPPGVVNFMTFGVYLLN